MDAKTLEVLAARCEGAQGADRELDAAIFWEIHRLRVERCHAEGIAMTDIVVFFHPRKHSYTASLDSALTLVPEGWAVNSLTEFNQHTWEAVLRTLDFVNDQKIYALSRTPGNERGVATPALALTAACLRALATKESNNV